MARNGSACRALLQEAITHSGYTARCLALRRKMHGSARGGGYRTTLRFRRVVYKLTGVHDLVTGGQANGSEPPLNFRRPSLGESRVRWAIYRSGQRCYGRSHTTFHHPASRIVISFLVERACRRRIRTWTLNPLSNGDAASILLMCSSDSATSRAWILA